MNKWFSKLFKYINNEEGNASVILSFSIIVLLSFTAYVVDIGIVYVDRAMLENGIDAAALAGVLELPDDSIEAEIVVNEYLVLNGINVNDVTIDIATDGKSMTIEADRQVDHVFAKIFGRNSSVVDAKTKVIIGVAGSVKGGIRPFAVEDLNYVYGEIATLKEEGGDGSNGNYGIVALGGTGASVAKDNILYGYDGVLNIGDIIETEPGNMTTLVSTVKEAISSDPTTFEDADRNSERVWTIPVVSTLDVNGRSETEIVGFAQFYVESIGTVNGMVEIQGRFMEFVANGDINYEAVAYGVYASKLVSDF